MSTQIRFPPKAARTGLRPTELMSTTDRKSTQRERLLAGLTDVTNRRGYAAATVTAVIAGAGVSRPTFYEYFADRDDCFRRAIEEVQDELLAEVSAAVHDRPAEQAADGAVRAVISYASAKPALARFLMGESMAGGADALDARDRGIARIADEIEAARAVASAGAAVPDLEARVLVGSVYRMIATRLRRGEAAISKLTDDLLGWLSAYRRPADQRRWQALSLTPLQERSPHVPDVPLQRTPGVLPPGRPRLSEAEIAENHRLRILYAAARLAESKGYSASTVAEITKLASVDGSVFYRHFADKQEAFTAVHELGFQQVMDVTAKAFFATEGWPERSWEAGHALTQLLQANPLVAHIGFVEAYAVGPGAVQRIEDSHAAFMFFLQEGLLHTSAEGAPTRIGMEAVVASVFEIIYLRVRAGEESKISAVLPDIAHMWLTPFLGIGAADDFIERRLTLLAHRG
jgi:AcrR family transcriptional regulator